MARKSSPEKEQAWREILHRQAASGLSIRRFCANERISEPSFFAWRKKLRGRNGRDPQERQAVSASGTEGMFLPLTLLDSTSAMEVIHPLGYRIRVTGEVNPVALRNVIDALDQRGAQ